VEPIVVRAEPGRDRAQALLLLASAVSAAEDLRAPGELLEQALVEAGDDVGLRVTAERRLAMLFIFTGDLRRAAHHSRNAVALSSDVDPTERAQAIALEAHIAFMVGDGFRRSSFERAIALYQDSEEGPESHPALLAAPTFVAAGELEAARAMLYELRPALEDWGVEYRLPFVLAMLVHIEIELGNYARAAELAGEAVATARMTQQPSLLAMALSEQARVAALRGDLAAATRSIDEGLELARRSGTNASGGAGVFAVVLGLIELSRGEPARACEHLAPLFDHHVAQGFVAASYFRFLGLEIEALVATGQLEQAGARLEAWEERCRILPAPLPLAMAARCRALLEAAHARPERALASVAEALEHHARVPVPFERAKTLLVKGAIERRVNERRAGRATLNEALEAFERLGAPLWAAKAREELARIGGRRTAGATDRLTPTEERVAELVAAGRTNREVADTLFVSVKTVEANLSRIYRKLDVRSRTELGARLRATSQPQRPEPSKR
jgi:DNA-binding CsgD family transcriptional regulator